MSHQKQQYHRGDTHQTYSAPTVTRSANPRVRAGVWYWVAYWVLYRDWLLGVCEYSDYLENPAHFHTPIQCRRTEGTVGRLRSSRYCSLGHIVCLRRYLLETVFIPFATLSYSLMQTHYICYMAPLGDIPADRIASSSDSDDPSTKIARDTTRRFAGVLMSYSIRNSPH